MVEYWNRISYTVQLILACLVFMMPAEKRLHFYLRTGLFSAIFIVGTFCYNTIFGIPEGGIAYFIYWAVYIVVAALFCWNGLKVPVSEAVYCMIFAVGMQHIAFDMYIIFQIAWGESFAVPIIIFVIVYVLFYIFLARRLTHRGRFIVTRRSLFSMLTIVMLVWMLSIMNNSGIDGFEAGIWQQVIYRMTDGLCCFYVLWVQLNQKENLSLQRELDGIRFMWQQQERQYEITSDTIENINRKCHDLKYQIHNLSDITDETEKREYLQELERDIMIYDVSLQTGNRALDVVLMEKGLFCKNHEIQWSCMVDGSRMNFMKAEDIYGIFGNALDNAIEAVSRLEDSQQRVISVKAIYQKKILVIQFQNYYQGDLEFRNGIPRTTKQNKQDHGYGMKSIRYTVEKYNGTVTVSTKNNIFTLQILIPLA